VSLAIRRAALSDAPALHRLIEGAYRGDGARAGWTHEADLLGGQRTDVAALEELLSQPGRLILMAEDVGVLVGCVHIADHGGGAAYLGMLTVDPTRQGAGLGRTLLDAAEAEARVAFSATRMEMTVIVQRAELIAWYERRGYALTGRTAPFPMDDPRFGLPKRDDLAFVVLEKAL
jgi:ribosomal protein S18 acetylase RimI-like enzyme